MTDVIKLIAETITTDEYGREEITEAERQVFAEVNSITRSEFYAAANTELAPDFRFDVFFGDYNDERIIEYDGKRYAVYRTYRAGDYMELYAERKIGA